MLHTYQSEPSNTVPLRENELSRDSSSHSLRKFLRSGAALVLAAILAWVLIPAAGLHAQVAGTGTIAGTITDPTGAVIAGAVVTTTNTATGLVSTQTTSDAGTYSIVALPAGEYTVDVRAAGFGGVHQQHVILNALSQIGLNLTLPVGTASQDVVVSEAPPPLQTENGTVETTIPQTTYNALPIAMNNGPKNPIGFVSLVAGVTGDPLFGTPVMNGGFQETSQIYVNGLPLSEGNLQGGASDLSMLSTEMIDQFQVLTSGVPASYDGQGVVNLVLKSGTNRIHGSVYENIRNTAFDAKGFFTHGPTPEEHQNEYGFTIGGPLIKDRLFYFGNFNGYKITTGSSPQFVTIPTLAERTGDFSAFPDPIYDPATTTCVGGICTRTAFPGNIIPADRLSSVAKSFQSYLPDPQNSNLENNYFNTFTNGNKNRMYMARVDAVLTSKNRATFMFQKGSASQVSLGAYLPQPYSTAQPGHTDYYSGQINDTHVITSNLLNVLGIQFFRWSTINSVPSIDGNYPANAGFTGLPSGPPSTAFPRINFAGPNAPYLWGTFSAFGEIANTYTIQDNVQWTHGKHSWTFGGQIIEQQLALNQPNALNGINFSNSETAGFNGDGTLNTSTGNAYASYLLGLVDSSSAQDSAIQETGGRFRNYAVYAQDNWKVTPKLTINLGLRYTIPKPFVEVQDRWSWFDPTLPNPLADGAPGLMVSAGYGPGSCHCRTNVKTHYKTFGPRVGFAYALNPKTVIRSSFGIVHYNGAALGGNGQQRGTGILGYATASPSFASTDGGITPAFLLDNGFPAYVRPDLGAFDSTINTGYTTDNPVGGGVSYDRPDTAARSPYTEQWNFNVERELPSDFVLSLSYNGTSSHFNGVQGGNGIYSNQINPKYLALGSLLQQTMDPTTLAQAQAQFPEIHVPFASFAGTIGQMLRPFPQYNGGGSTWMGPDQWANFGTGSYNGLQTTLSRRMKNGLYLLSSYTWSKTFDDGGHTAQFFAQAPRSAYNLGAERSVSYYDTPHVFSFSQVYELPFGKGRRFAINNRIVNGILGGWQLSGIEQYHTGVPVGSIFGNCNTPFSGGAGIAVVSAPCYADYNSSFSGNVKLASIGSGTPGVTPYFTAAAFQDAQPFTFGNTPRTLAFGSLRYQWYKNESVSVSKTFQIRENISFQFKADAFNLFNRTQFGGIGTNIASSGFGQVTTQSNIPRQLQFEGMIRF
ncbi:MAG: TonB-dependent receptor [Acidobacteria bacterium]|nr:TonB-dependent receptor [Acidobacteriota bacterium]